MFGESAKKSTTASKDDPLAAAASLLEALAMLNRTLFDDIFESPLPTAQAPRSSRVGLLTATRDILASARQQKTAIEDALNAINEFVEGEVDIAAGVDVRAKTIDRNKDRELDVEGGPARQQTKKAKGDEDDEKKAEEEEEDDEDQQQSLEELKQQAADKIRDDIYDLSDQLYTDLILPRMAVAEALLGAKTALSLRSKDYVAHASEAIHSTFRLTNTKLAEELSYGPALLQKYSDAAGGDSEACANGLPLSWMTNDLLDEAEEELAKRQGAEAEDAKGKEKEAADRKALIACRLVLQEVPEGTRSLLDAVNAFERLFRIVDEEAVPPSRASSPFGSHNTSLGEDCVASTKTQQQVDEALEGLCDSLLDYGVVDAEMWIADYVKTARRRQLNQTQTNNLAESQRGISRTTSALKKSAVVQRTTSFANNAEQQNTSASQLGSNDASVSGLPRTISGNFSTPRKKAMLLSASKKGGDELDVSDAEEYDGELSMSNPSTRGKATAGQTGGGNSALRSTSFILNNSSSGGGGALEGSFIGNSPSANTFEALISKLDAIMATPSPQSTPESLAITSRLYDLLGRINLLLRRAGMAKETKVTSEGKVVPTAADEVKVYLEHQLDEVQGFGKRESILYEHACLCFENWSRQNKVRMELDGLINMADDEFYRAADAAEMFTNLFADADRYCVMSENREAVVKRIDKLLIIRIKIYHHSGEVRVLTIPQRMPLTTLIDQKLLTFFPDSKSCEISFLDDGDKVRISSDEEFSDLIKMRRSVAIDSMGGGGLGSTSLLGSSQILGRSQIIKSLMSNSELKLELYLDPILHGRGASGALAARVSSAAGNGRQPKRDSPPAPPSHATSDPRPGALPSKSQVPTKAKNEDTSRMSLNEIIRQQEASDAKKLEALGIDWSKVSLGASQTSLPQKPTSQGGRNTGYATLGAHQANTIGGTFDLNTIGTADLTAFFDRKMAEKGLALPVERTGGYATIGPTISPAPPTPFVPQYRNPAASAQQATPTPTPAPTQPASANTQATRDMFFAMGRAKREAEGTSATSQHHNGGIHSDLAGQPTPSRGGTAGIVLTETAKGSVPNSPQRPQTTNSNGPTGSVVLVNGGAGRWRVPPNAGSPPSFPPNSASVMNRANGSSILIADTNDSADEDEIDELIGHPTWRGRGMTSADHIAAVMNSNSPTSNPNGPLRHNGPLRRGGVPLPQNARRGR